MWFRMINFNVMGVHWKNPTFKEVHEKQYIRGKLPKKGCLDSCRFKKGFGKKEGADVFEVGFRPQCTL